MRAICWTVAELDWRCQSTGLFQVSFEIVQFDDFELDRNAHELRCGGAVVKLERIPLELLFLLVNRRGQVVTREEILEHVWGKGVFRR